MKRRDFLQFSGAAFAAGLFPASAFARGATTVSYGSGRLDIYPAPQPGGPVVAYVHGGAWRAGNKSEVGSMPGHFNSLGYTFVSIGYSLSADPGQQASQIGQAVSWIRSNIGQYGGNGSRIALMGHSAGCHLASLAVLSGRASGVRALVANDTQAWDLPYLPEIKGGRLPDLYAVFNSLKSQWRTLSPISYAGGGGGIPVLVAWSGGADRPMLGRRFADALSAGGHPVTRFDGSRYNHFSIRSAMGRRGDALNSAITQFLQRTL